MMELIKTGIKFFGLNIYLDSTGREDVDIAAKQLFYDDYRHTASLDMIRDDVQLVLAWSKGELEEHETQYELFE